MDNYTDEITGQENGLHLSRVNNIEKRVQQSAPNWEQLKKELDEETTVYKAPELSGEHMGTASKIVMKLTGFLIYVALIILFMSCVWYCFQDLSRFHSNLFVVLAAYVLSGVVCTIDAVVINRGYKPKKSLYLFAWLLNFIYPFQRSNHLLKKNNIGDYALVIAVVLGFVGVGYKAVPAQFQYKAVYLVKDASGRQEIETLLSQNADGVPLGEQLYKSFHVSGVAVNKNDRVTKVVLIGKSNHIVDPGLEGKTDVKWNIKENLFVKKGSYDVSTQLVFIKGSHSSEYRLSTVKLDEEALLPSYIYNYWRKVILRWDEYGQRVD
ncbi:MAG: hypothetical protein PUC12_09985 [Clostridiales bacterium]|nr:hypothetical protein [Clostridiales bacterium]